MTDHTATDTPPMPPAVGAQVQRGVRPVAWMWMQATWLEGDVRGRGWYQRIDQQKPNMPWMEENLQPLYDQASLDNARQAIYEAEAAQLMAPLRARIAELEAIEEGAKVAFGHVVDAKRASEKDCRRTQELLDAAYAQIRRLNGLNDRVKRVPPLGTPLEQRG